MYVVNVPAFAAARAYPRFRFPSRWQVGQVKTIIQTAQGFDASLQKLIFAGKILSDGQTLEEAKVGEGAFLVCMVSKVRLPFSRLCCLCLTVSRH